MGLNAHVPCGCPDDSSVPCEHDGHILEHHLGNSATVKFIRESLERTPELFPTIIAKVVFSGVHCGDSIPIEDLPKLKDEIDLLCYAQCDKLSPIIEHFERKLKKLVEGAIEVGRPIQF